VVQPEVVQSCRGGAEVQRCTGADPELRRRRCRGGAEVEQRGYTEVVHRWCSRSGVEEVQRC